jgi:DNA-damage-inducible protein D
MKTDLIHTLTGTFEAHAQQAENGIEFWLARDLQHLPGYDEWRSCDTLLRSSRLREQLRCASSRNLAYRLTCRRRNFSTVISKAKTSCEVSGHPVADHFVDVNKTIAMPKGAEKEVPDLMLTRYACYLIAQNGDPRTMLSARASTPCMTNNQCSKFPGVML